MLACRIFVLTEDYTASNLAKELTAEKGEIVEVANYFISSFIVP